MKKEKIRSNKRPKIQILETPHNEIINFIGSRPAESGGLLFGKEDDMIVRKFVPDIKAKVTSSSYTFNTEYLNPEIQRIWKEEGLSCIGFIHSHPHGYGWLSPPDIDYFNSMFEKMPRKYYITPVVFTVPDGGYKFNPLILYDKSKKPVIADLELLPDDFDHEVEMDTASCYENESSNFFEKTKERFKLAQSVINSIWMVWKLILALGLSWFLFKALYILTNYLQKILL